MAWRRQSMTPGDLSGCLCCSPIFLSAVKTVDALTHRRVHAFPHLVAAVHAACQLLWQQLGLSTKKRTELSAILQKRSLALVGVISCSVLKTCGGAHIYLRKRIPITCSSDIFSSVRKSTAPKISFSSSEALLTCLTHRTLGDFFSSETRISIHLRS